LESEVKGIEDKLGSTQMQIIEIARRPHQATSEIPEQEKSQLTALAALKAELIQKTSVYSDAHPAVTSLKKRIAAMEKTMSQPTQTPAAAQTAPTDDLESLKRQKEVFEKRLDDANGKLATARLSEKLDRDQQTERLQVIESPPLPLKPTKQNRLKFVGMAFALAAMLGIGAVVGTEMSDGSIRARHQLSGVVDSHLIVSVPYIATRADIIRARWRVILVTVTVVTLLAVLGGLVAAIALGFPVDFAWFNK
jgi:capsule polysaccharide export protein KpsE/RkpR